ncbi:1-aminocyclopropane-1-carboxylate synthase [Linum grandiflorum]
MMNDQLLSRMATGAGHGENSNYFDGWKAYDSNPFHLQSNPDGVIQMGLAENQLCFDLVENWVKNNPASSICTAEGSSGFKDIAIFQDYHGLPQFRNAVANFMAKVRGDRVRFDPDRIVMAGGATGAHETLAFCLANPGEALLVPTPYYPGFDRDLRWRTGIELVPIECKSSNNFKLRIEDLEAAYETATLNNIRVKGLLLTNPSNPLGTILDGETLRSVVAFTNSKSIHLICDEIYSATVFGGDAADYVSIAEIVDEDRNSDVGPKLNLDLIHLVYSLSKDMGFPGFRVGIIYSYNDVVVGCARKMSSFGLVSAQTQHMIGSMLADDKFVGEFVAANRRRLSDRHQRFTAGLERVGIRCLRSGNAAGLFVWMDLRRMMKEQSVEAETALWKVIIDEVKLNVSPGTSFHCSEPGWFRVCFANMDDPTMEVALARIRAFVAKNKPAKARKLCAQRSLKLSFNGRVYEDFLMSPSSSPIAQSPLVRART